MEETSEELPNFSIGIDFLGPDPITSKNKAKKKTCKLGVSQISLATEKVTNWSLTTFKGKISVFIVVFKFVQSGE